MKILLADKHPLVLLGIQYALEADGEFETVGATRSGAEVLPLVGQRDPNVVLLDVHMPKLDGFGCLRRIRAQYPEVKVVMTSSSASPEQVQLAFDGGACGFVVKSIDAGDLASAIRQAVNGTAFYTLGSPVVNEAATARAAGLTERELAILKAVARGLSNGAIGKELWVTEQTVKFHLTNVYRKIDVTNRTEAARWAFARGFASDAEPPSGASSSRLSSAA
jgi:DNA-binding NarL/FixJ family response regulator